MKNKFAFLLLVALIAGGCDAEVSLGTTTKQAKSITALGTMRTTVIEGCEYFLIENGWSSANHYAISLTHKGNCTNSIHKCNCQ